jgi:DNA polymerase-3 subunit epsilon
MSSTAAQPSFDDLGVPLSGATFVVVDLETTGGAADAEITEIGAVKVRGGEVLGEFQTLVRPSGPVPPMIQVLTGITSAMVASAPPPSAALPAFAEFSAGAVLVAHNARFDTGFLRRGYEQLGMPWPRPTVVDTVAVARAALLRDEVPNCKLGTLARYFRASTEPDHRALSDARATVDVLHGLLERVGNLGVHTLEDLAEFALQVSPDRRAKRVWATSAPEAAGVYWFYADGVDADGAPRREVLYVGKSNNLRPLLLLSRGEARTDPRDGAGGHRGRSCRMRDRPGGGGPGVADDRVAVTALQPALEESAGSRLAAAHAGGVPAAVDRPAARGRAGVRALPHAGGGGPGGARAL